MVDAKHVIVGGDSDVFLSVVESSFQEDALAVFVDEDGIVGLRVQQPEELLYLHDDQSLVFPLEVLPEDEVAEDF